MKEYKNKFYSLEFKEEGVVSSTDYKIGNFFGNYKEKTTNEVTKIKYNDIIKITKLPATKTPLVVLFLGLVFTVFIAFNYYLKYDHMATLIRREFGTSLSEFGEFGHGKHLVFLLIGILIMLIGYVGYKNNVKNTLLCLGRVGVDTKPLEIGKPIFMGNIDEVTKIEKEIKQRQASVDF